MPIWRKTASPARSPSAGSAGRSWHRHSARRASIPNAPTTPRGNRPDRQRGSAADRPEQPQLREQGDRLRARLAAELLDDIVEVEADGDLLDADQLGDLGLAIALGERACAIPFARREARALVGRVLRAAAQEMDGDAHEVIADREQ